MQATALQPLYNRTRAVQAVYSTDYCILETLRGARSKVCTTRGAPATHTSGCTILIYTSHSRLESLVNLCGHNLYIFARCTHRVSSPGVPGCLCSGPNTVILVNKMAKNAFSAQKKGVGLSVRYQGVRMRSWDHHQSIRNNWFTLAPTLGRSSGAIRRARFLPDLNYFWFKYI